MKDWLKRHLKRHEPCDSRSIRERAEDDNEASRKELTTVLDDLIEDLKREPARGRRTD